MNNDDDPVKLDTRLSGQLKRYHTWPIIGQQTVAEHCWQIIRIYLSVVDKIDPHVISHIMFHDIGEAAIGDLPYPVKSENHDLKIQADYIENKSRFSQLDYWNAFRMVALTKEDEKLFKDIELIEMAEFGLDQMCLGNGHGFIIADRCLKKVYHNSPCARLVSYIMTRLDIFREQYHVNTFNDGLGEWWFAVEWRNLITHGFKLEVVHESE